MPKSCNTELSFVVLTTFLQIESTILLIKLDKTTFKIKPIAYIATDRPITVSKYITGPSEYNFSKIDHLEYCLLNIGCM